MGDWDPVQYKSLADAAGQQFGVPKYQGTLVLYYNKDIFDQYGVAYPTASWTHDDYLAAMKLLTHDTNGDGAHRYLGQHDRYRVGPPAGARQRLGRQYRRPVKTPASRSSTAPATLAALDWVRARMWDDKVMATFTDVNNLGTQSSFAGGKLAMVEDGSWALKNILEHANFRIGIAPIPSGPVRRVTLSTTDGFGIYSGTRYPEAGLGTRRDSSSAESTAWRWRRPTSSNPLDYPCRRLGGFVKQQYPEKSAGMDLDVFAAPHREGYSVVQEIFPRDMADATQLVAEAFTEIFTLGQAPVGILRVTRAAIDRAQASVRAKSPVA